MRILIGYDGSKSSESAIDDLVRAGLPSEGSIQVISVAEAWMRSLDEGEELGPSNLEEHINHEAAKSEKAGSEAKMMSRFAEERVKRLFPKWQVSSCAAYGSPAREILLHADEMKADLIVVGSFGHSTLSRFILGSISQKVLAEARCSVRIARGSVDVEWGPARLIIAFDGSKGALAAVDAVTSRHWENPEVLLVGVTESVVPSAIGRFVPPVARIAEDLRSSDRLWLEKLAGPALEKLVGSGINGQLCIKSGNPREVLVELAESWGADCIFAGAHHFGNKLERVLLGSTSAAIAARATCSVEVVRNWEDTDPPPDPEIDDVVKNWRSLR